MNKIKYHYKIPCCFIWEWNSVEPLKAWRAGYQINVVTGNIKNVLITSWREKDNISTSPVKFLRAGRLNA